VLPVALLALAGCGSDDDAGDAATTDQATPGTAAADTTAAEVTVAATDPSSAATTEVPDTTEPPAVEQLDAVELLTSMNIVGTDYGPDYTVTVDVADLSTPNAVVAREAAENTPECGSTEAPLPYSTLSSGARIDFANSIGATSSAEVVVMPMEAAAIGYLEAMRSDETIPTCMGLATLKTLTGAPPGITIDMENFRFGELIANYGDDQVTTASDLVISQDGAVLLNVEGGSRYSRIGNVILVVSGTSPGTDDFAPVFYAKALEAIDAS
jgi:hypothetical protein